MWYVILGATKPDLVPCFADESDGKRSVAGFADAEWKYAIKWSTPKLRSRRRSALENGEVRRYSGYDHGIYVRCLYNFSSRK